MNADGSYDVLFDTGERELRVVRSKLKILNVQPGSIGSTMGSLGELQEIKERRGHFIRRTQLLLLVSIIANTAYHILRTFYI